MKNCSPFILFFISMTIYWQIFFLVSIGIDSLHSGDMQYLFSTLLLGIVLFPFVCIVELFIFSRLYKQWAKKKKKLLRILFVFLLFACIFVLCFNAYYHSI